MVISRAAYRMESTSLSLVGEGYPAVADAELLLALVAAAERLGVAHHVGLTATAAGFYAAPARALQTDSPLAGRIQKAVKYRMIDEELSVQDKFKLLKDLGFDGVEPHVRDTMSVDKREFLKASELTGVRIHGVANSASPDIRAAVDLARFLGADSVLIVAGRVQKDKPYDVVYRETQTLLREALPYAAQHRIALLVENVWNNFLLSPLEMARYLDELDHESAAAYFDVGNVVRLGWPEHWIRILRQRIAKLDRRLWATSIGT